MSQEMGICWKHRRLVFDDCPECESEMRVSEFFEEGKKLNRIGFHVEIHAGKPVVRGGL